MRTDTHTDVNENAGKTAVKNTTALTSLGMRGTTKPGNELMSVDEAEDDSPPRKCRKRRKPKDKSGKHAAAKVSAPAVVTDYMTTKQAAAYLTLSRQYLEAARYRGDGSGPAFIKLQRAVRYRRSTLDAWMAAHDHSPDVPIK
jgi:hypothetical protein